MERLLQRILADPAARAYPLIITVSPGREDVILRSRLLDRSRVVAGLTLLLLALLFLVNGIAEGLASLIGIAVMMLATTGLAIGVAWTATRTQWRVQWMTDAVQVYDRRWWRAREWSAKLSEFEGIGVRELVLGQAGLGRVRTSVVYHLAELRHPDPLKSVLIASHIDAERVEKAAAQASRTLNVARI